MPLPPDGPGGVTDRVAIVCLADTDGQHRRLHIPTADILIHSGGFARTRTELSDFDAWLGTLHVTTKIVVAGGTDFQALDYSHRDPRCQCCPVGSLLDVCPIPRVRDCVCDRRPSCCEGDDPLRWDEACVALLPRCGVRCAACYASTNRSLLTNAIVLQDTQVIVEGLKIYGSSWQSTHRDRSFYIGRDKRIAEKWALIPSDVDVLVTHVPPYGRGDRLHTAFVPESAVTPHRTILRHLPRPFGLARRVRPPVSLNDTLTDGSPAGDYELLLRTNALKPRLHVFGEAVAGRGVYRGNGTGDLVPISINAVAVDPKTGRVFPPFVWPLRRIKGTQIPLHIE
eukprot:TRINITY_DN5912_c0_g1_i1.p1 TRINITY_DN5912_c0_g1~~TRINITY_DN5912_c0_g1_i1.p1  ORF type:complete len:340 (-),score=66.03 TRINITY_DN5912_c0_g1_i1:76-1095(-)